MSELIKVVKASRPLKRFPQPVSLPTGFVNTRILRDNFKRQMAAEYEVTSKALKFIARNAALPQKMRLEAQIQLAAMPNYTRMNQVRDRCLESGTAKKIIKPFRVGRYQFRLMAKEGEFPGVKKGVW
ncbi:hypothetical protein KL930_001896 [Ogataea haglerorum]|uniref:Uncharacterized protein n=1 Tax=Ogataea haglerorum TaxID=1937702 RepID=A0AAN6I210_9ASCO|nr:uncharacterized protein KL911_001837 [Ogataea haglerorum]KAG7698235.1 hypothetical protein KL915_001952 [Ogataea haglerorum]KAG7699472.1 hypothetical protein KL951_001189 [Ogataea haglerorum]KAG7708456.1 hypothetical protein KL914_002182 [Ogataea haglerorum]KAG7710516.1 hypothetical protein KL950_001429 [Ogataea haglerorum]KAG7721138.1 hypothetical protein KL913_000874 [Ogataea haglerorum]